jgi:hypothetical protein
MNEESLSRKLPALQPHEQAALQQAQMSPEDAAHLLEDIEVLSARLYRQLVDWHTVFPEKPALQDSNQFWSQMKELRAAQFEVENLRKAVREQELRQQTLSVQLEKAESTVKHIEKAFSGYLDRVNDVR